MDSMHNSVFGGHLGIRKTTGKVLQKHYWYDLRSDVKVWIQQCDTCAANKRPVKAFRAGLGDMRTGAPLDRLNLDILGPLPLSHKGNQYIQVVTDAFTKWVEIMPVPDQTAATCAEHLIDEIIARFGCPLSIHTDQGRNYESNLFKELCRLLEIHKTRTTPRHPQGNGQTERFNRTLIQMIKAYIKDDQREWDQHLGCLAAAYRSSPHEVTGFTPNFLMLGKEIRLPGELDPPEPESYIYADYVENLRCKLSKAHAVARQHLATYARKQKDHYDIRKHPNRYQPGDLVWYRNDQHKEGVCHKLQSAYFGPYVVLRNYSDLDYLIHKGKQGRQAVVHHDHLKPYAGTSKPKWAQQAMKKYLAKQKQKR